MAFRPAFQRSPQLPLRTTLLTAGAIYFATGTAHAEAPSEMIEALKSRKPIYDSDEHDHHNASAVAASSSSKSPTPDSPPQKSSITSSIASLLPGSSSSSSTSTQPETFSERPLSTPTDRLAGQVKRARLFLHANAALAEDKVNDAMTSFLKLEHSFTSTIASLAPPKESGERLMPGVIYVLVATMAGSIVTRNRNILLRASVPAAVGVAAGWVVLPITMRNVGDLAWKYEERVPFISNNHMRIRGFTEEAWRTTKVHGKDAANVVDETLQQGRETVEDWVKKGR